MKESIALMTILVGFGITAIAAIIIATLLLWELFVTFPSPDPITYETGLYVESEQVQQTLDGKELQ